MKVVLCRTEHCYVIDHVTAGDMVWLQMNSRIMRNEMIEARFPDARIVEHRYSGKKMITAIIFDDLELGS